MDDAYYAQRALDRIKRAEERARQRVVDDQFLAAFDKRFGQREAHREARDDILAKVESDARVRQASRSTTSFAAEDPAVAAERARKIQAEEADRQRARDEAKRIRDEERAAAEAKEQAAAAEEDKRRKQRDAEKQRAREAAEAEAEAAREADEKARQQARDAKLKAQREDQERLEDERKQAAAKREADRLAKEEDQRREDERIAKDLADKKKAQEEKARQDREREAAEDAERVEAAKVAAEESKRAADAKRKAKEEEDAQKAAADKKAEEDRIASEKATADKKAEDDRIASEKAAADKKAEDDRIAAEEKAAADKKVEDDRIASDKAAADKAEEDRIASEKAIADKKAEDDRIASEKLAADQKAEEDRIASEKATADKKAEDDRIASEKAAADKKAEDDRIAAEEKATADKAEEDRIASESAASAAAKAEEDRIAAEKKAEDDEEAAERRRIEEEEAILKADEDRLAAEEAAAEANGHHDDDMDSLDEEEAALLAEEEAMRLEEEALRREEEEENARLLAEEEADSAAAAAATKQAEDDRIASEKLAADQKAEEDRIASEKAAADKKAEDDRIASEKAAADKKAEDDRIAAEEKAAAAKAEEDRIASEKAAADKKADEDRIASEKAAADKKAEDDRIASEKAAADKKAEEDRIAAEKVAAEKAAPEASAEPAPAGASKKAAFLAALNNKIGLGGPPPKSKPAAADETSPAPESTPTAPSSTSSASTTDSEAAVGVDLLGESAAPRLAPLTQTRAKGPNRNHRATLAGIRSRMEADGTQSFFVGEVQATPHVDGQVREAEDALPAAASATEESAPAQRKLPPGAMAMPGMGLGGLMGAIKKSADRRASIAVPSSSSSSPVAAAAVETKLPPVRLIHVRGKGKDLFVRLVEPTLTAMSHDAAFILEDVKASTLYVWSGYNANKMQTTKCLDLVSRINRGEHAGRAQTNTLRAGEETDAFWGLLGATPAPALAKTIPQVNGLPLVVDTLYRVDPTDDGFVLVELASETKNLDRGLLWSDACYILDSGYEVRAWIGKSSPKEMRDAALSQANDLLSKPTKNGDARPAWSQVVYKEADRGETVLFTDKFASWPAEYKPKLAAAPPSRARAASAAAESVSKQNSATPSGSPAKSNGASNGANGSPASKPTNSRLAPYDGPSMAAIERPASADKVLPDEGIHGAFTAWIQDGFEKKPYPKSRIGIYDDSHCYISMYSWGLTGSERHMVYFWQGSATSPNDQGSAAGLAREINERICKGSGQLVRVPQFHENEHFLLCHATQKQPYVSLGASLNGSLEGKVVRFIHVRGRSANNAKAHQVQVDASALNTNDVFIAILDSGKTAPLDAADAPYISDTKEAFIWQGRESNDFLRQYAKETVARLVGASSPAPQIVDEGSENARFWALLGQPASAKPTYITGRQADNDLKIYMCTANSQEGFKIGRIWDYSNFDICSDRVLIVEDSNHHVYVWMGSRTAEPERKLSLESALAYAATVSAPTPVTYMYEGHETLQFKALFHGWTTKQPLDTKTVAGNGEVEKLLPLYLATYSLTQLKDRTALPPTVDQANLEYHLNEEDFTAALKMTRDAFFALPEWKRLEAKKTSPIF